MAQGPVIRTLQPGEYLCFQGQDSNEMFVVRSGKLDIYVVDQDGIVSKEKVEEEGMLVGSVDTPNSFIGEIGGILREPRSASIKAAEETQVQVINLRGSGFDQTIMQNTKLGLNLSKTIAGRLGATSNNLTRADSLSMKVKGHVDNFSRKFFQVFNAIEQAAFEIAKAEAGEEAKPEDIKVENPLLDEAGTAFAYQIGKLAEKYGSVPIDLYASMELPYNALTNIFVNRIYKGGAAPANVEVPSGPPKPGVAGFEPGTVVCAEQSVDDKMYILLAGKLEVFVGMRSIETVQGKGSIFGEMAMFGDMQRTSGIRAITDVHAMPIPKDKIGPFLMAKPAVMLHVLRSFAKRLPLLNEALLNTVHQMTDLMHLFGACLNAYEGLVPRLKTDLGPVAEKVANYIADMEATQTHLAPLFDEVNGEYTQLCSEIGYRPSEEGEVQVKGPRVIAPTFPFVTKFEQLEELDSEHINFALNPKNDQFRACSIEFKHQDLLTQAKVKKDSFKEFLFGTIINYGESFPQQFLAFDLSSGGLAQHDKEYAIRTIKVMLERMEQEIFFLYDDQGLVEVCYVPDYVPVESDELVDEATILEFIEKFKKEPDNRDILTELNNLYWDLIIGTIQKKMPKVKETTVEFDETERKLINFGLLDEKFLPNNSEVLPQIAEDAGFQPSEEQDLRYMYIEDIVQDVYKEAFGFNALGKLLEQRKVLENDVKSIQERMGVLTKGRLDLINSFPNGNAAAAFAQKLDALVKAMSVMDRMMKAGRQLSSQQRGQIVTFKNNKNALTTQLSNFFTAIKGRVNEDQVKQFRDFGDEYEKKCMEDLIAQEKLAAHEEKIKEHQAMMKGITLKTKETTYKNEIVRLKKYVVLTAKKCKVEPIAVLVGTREIATRTRVSEIIDLFLADNVDSHIFDPKQQRIRKLGKPSILLLPGSGVAVYDWEKHMLLVPLNPPKTLEESLANAFVEFHWDMDEDKSMRESYGEIKIYKKLSITKLKIQLAKDYITWATKESKGWKMLDKEVRGWFMTKIAKVKSTDPAAGGEGDKK